MNIKKIALTILLAFSLGTISEGIVLPNHHSAEAANKTGTVTSTVNVRLSATVHSKKIGTKKKGSKITILSTKNKFYKINFGKNGGWVSAKYVKVNSSKKKKNPPACSLSEYKKIKLGMTLKQVQSIIGSKGKQDFHYSDGDYTYSDYEFKGNAEYSLAYISFENGKVESKMQTGLK